MNRKILLRLFALVACLSWATASAQYVSVYMPDVSGVPGETVTIPVSIYCDVDMTSFLIRFSTDLGVSFTSAEFVDRIDPSANTYISNGGIMAYNFNGIDFASLEAGDGVVAEFYLKIPADAEPGNYTMTLYDMQFQPIGSSGSANTIYPNDFTATLTVGSSTPEAYACYTPSDSTLTFYYDNLRATRSGTTYDLNTGTHNPGWYSDGTYSSVTRVVFNSSFANARPTSTKMWFYMMENLQSITGLNYLNTSEVTRMTKMFQNCKSLTSLDLSGFNTSLVTDMNSMFGNCWNLTSLNVSSFNTANVAYMQYMFYECNRLTSLDVSSFNTAKVIYMSGMFEGCWRLTSLDVSGFSTANVTTMSAMFESCADLTSLNLSSFNTANVTNMGYMFDGCSNLTSLNLSGFNTTNVTVMYYMFENCSLLTTIYVGGEWSTAAVTSSTDMFKNCTKLVGGKGTTYDANHVDATYAHIDGGTSNPGYFTGKEAYACYTSSNATLTFYYDDQRTTRTGMTYDLNTGSNNAGWTTSAYHTFVESVVFDPSFAAVRPTTTYNWFAGMDILSSITGINYLNTSEVTNMNGMFAGCTSLMNLDLSRFNTSKVTDMNGMFDNCNNLTSLDLSSFNTSKVTDMAYMFCNCNNVTTIYVGSGWSTSAVTSSGFMFDCCFSIKGGKGTTYSSNHVDKAYARIDGGTSNPGYFTARYKGDVNGDGLVNITDAIKLINYLATGDPTGINLAAADCNGDSTVNITDAIKLINFLASGLW